MKRCVRCFVHGEMLSHSSIKCARKTCGCRKCELVDIRRGIKNQLDQMRKKRKVKLGHGSEKDVAYTCLRCRHHGVVAPKKFHSPCPFSACRCKSCVLIEERTRIEKELTRLQRRNNGSEAPASSVSASHAGEDRLQDETEKERTEASRALSAIDERTTTVASSLSSCETDETLSQEAQIILHLLIALAADPKSVYADNCVANIISNLLSQPTFDLPLSWLSEWPTINYLLGESLKRFPNLVRSLRRTRGDAVTLVASVRAKQCELVNRRRAIKSLLDKLRRRNKANRVFESANDSPYTCLRCRHHGVMASKRFHAPCPFSLCRCKSCDLIEERTQIEKELTQIHRRERNPGADTAIDSPKSTQTVLKAPDEEIISEAINDSILEVTSHTDDTETIGSSHSIHENDETEFLSPEAQIILDLITALSEDPKSVNPDNFDASAISNLLSLPTFDLPLSWLSEWPNIHDLLGESLKRFQIP
ncbi:hypothetical protein PRIPAC_81403 [Pristionchus pacificus]|uniref:Uncharacterized protein n=1 Tax=Pristionchus pacificus TaxID=54126 RepID=A0A2A6CJG4_PRIPA|nr:hypothetical protein PRIPAC_81403 [Pristionchus pacificus]|eukprot:PDM78269.1 hypothetical protein PRIPAC_30848 [Pristionchus pacificus]